MLLGSVVQNVEELLEISSRACKIIIVGFIFVCTLNQWKNFSVKKHNINIHILGKFLGSRIKTSMNLLPFDS